MVDIDHRIFYKSFDGSRFRLRCYNTNNYFENSLTIKCNIMLIDGNPTTRDHITKKKCLHPILMLYLNVITDYILYNLEKSIYFKVTGTLNITNKKEPTILKHPDQTQET